MRDRDKQKKRYYRSRNLLEWEKYRVLRNKVVSMRRKAVQDHFKTLYKEKYADQRKFWNTIRLYINSCKKKNNSRILLKENDRIMREPREVAETLNDFFSNIVGTDKTTERMNDFTHFPHDYASGQITLNYSSPNEVKGIMCNMKTNKAIGHDLIPARAMKDSAEVLCEPYCTLFNYILDIGKIPKQWKKGEITPVKKTTACLRTITDLSPFFQKSSKHSSIQESVPGSVIFSTNSCSLIESIMVVIRPCSVLRRNGERSWMVRK